MSGPWRAGVLSLAAFLVYNLNVREISSQDTIPARVLPVELIRDHRLDLDRYFRDEPRGAHLPYWVQRVRGHYVSSYPLVPGLLAVPIYLVPVIVWGGDSWLLINLLAKLSASGLAAASVLVVYLVRDQSGVVGTRARATRPCRDALRDSSSGRGGGMEVVRGRRIGQWGDGGESPPDGAHGGGACSLRGDAPTSERSRLSGFFRHGGGDRRRV